MKEICIAIKSKRLVSFTYNGLKRTAELYRQGRNRHTTKMQVRAYQVDGDSNSNKLGWKLFNSSDIKKFKMLPKTFELREEYNSNKLDDDITNDCKAA